MAPSWEFTLSPWLLEELSTVLASLKNCNSNCCFDFLGLVLVVCLWGLWPLNRLCSSLWWWSTNNDYMHMTPDAKSLMVSSEHCIFSLWVTMYIFLLVLRRIVANMASLFNHLGIILKPFFLYVAFNAMKCLPSCYTYYFYHSWFPTFYFLRVWYTFVIGDNKNIFILMSSSMSVGVGGWEGGRWTPKITTLNCSNKECKNLQSLSPIQVKMYNASCESISMQSHVGWHCPFSTTLAEKFIYVTKIRWQSPPAAFLGKGYSLTTGFCKENWECKD